MTSERIPAGRQDLFGRHPVGAYFSLTFGVSWLAALAVASPDLVRGEPISKLTGILMFPAMLLGPSLSGVVMTRIADGKTGLRELFSRMFRARAPARWYAVLTIPPILVKAVLLFLTTFVSPAYTPNRFFVGILFGIPAGFLEEIGWTGYAYPRMCSRMNGLSAGVLLGLLWSLWHAPVIDHLGTAVPHGVYWLPFFLAFALAMTAMRVLISWVYVNTRSVLLAQLMHTVSTGSLVIFSPSAATAAQEVMWYAVYGLVLWLAVAIVVRAFGQRLRH